MADRSVSVRLRADISQFQRSMVVAAASASALERNLQGAGRGIDETGRSSERSGKQIDKLSGRLSLLAQAGLAVGPAFGPIAALAVPAVAGLSSALGFAAIGAGTAMLAFQGVGDALSKLNTAQLDPTAAHLKAARLAMEALSPSASEFVRLLDQTGPALDKLKQSAGTDMFPGLTIGLRGALTTLPQVRALLEVVGGAVGNLGEMTGESLASGKWNGFLSFLKAEAPPAIEALGQMMGNLASGASDLWVAFAPLNTDVLGWLHDATQSFSDWSAGLSQTQGFEKFISYIQTAGPQVSETLGAIGNMVLQVGEAFAPLGGPVLTILTTMADLISTIADSPLGTPFAAIATAVSTLSLLNKGLASTQGLLGGLRAGGSAGGAAAAGGGIGSYFQTNADQVREAAGSIRSNVSTIGAVVGTAGARTARESARMSTAFRGIGTSAGQMAAGVGKAGAPVAALALLSTGVADKLGVTNTASLALAGSMAGPVGAAVGVGVGALLDLKAAGAGATDALGGLNDAAALGNLDVMKQRISDAKAELDDYKSTSFGSGFLGLGDIAQRVGTDVSNVSQGKFSDQNDEYAASLEKASAKEKEMAASAAVAAQAQANLSSYVEGSNVALFAQTQSLESAVKSMQAVRSEALKAADSQLNYKSAVLDAKDALKENGRNLNLNTRGGIANKQALDNLAAAWNGQSDAAKNASGAMRASRQNFVTTATGMGMAEARARTLARRLFELPSKKVIPVTILSDADKKIAGIRAELASLRNKTIFINTVYTGRKPNAGGMGPQVGSSADGGTVTGGPRYPYGDKVLYALAPTEEIISNRHGQADQFRADRAAGRIPGYADGGTTGKAPKKARAQNRAGRAYGDLDVNTTIDAEGASDALAKFASDLDDVRGKFKDAGLVWSKARKDQTDDLKRSAQGFDNLVSSLKNVTDAQTSYAADVSSKFSNDIFGNGLAGLGKQLQADTNDAATFQSALASAVSQGLDGGLLSALGASGDVNTAQQLAASGAGGIASYESMFNQREAQKASLGTYAGSAVYGAEVVKQTAAVKSMETAIKKMENQIGKLGGHVERGAEKGSHTGTKAGTEGKAQDKQRTTQQVTQTTSRGGRRKGGK